MSPVANAPPFHEVTELGAVRDLAGVSKGGRYVLRV
jgi:hypothetical protein